jgi:8-oxo-dGTP pyrophosphatase MutT (NUDIX family)
MYKIYINNAPLILLEKDSTIELEYDSRKMIEASYLGKSKFFFPYIDYLEKNGEGHCVILRCTDVVQTYSDFAQLFQVIEAGGGVVRNTEGEILMIFRRGFWDLPKGKAEDAEHILQTAVREVKEETGIYHVSAGEHLINTYHTYRTGKGKRVLKVSKWFLMQTRDKKLVPQKEEDIEKAEWVDSTDILHSDIPLFNNIREVIEHYNRHVLRK